MQQEIPIVQYRPQEAQEMADHVEDVDPVLLFAGLIALEKARPGSLRFIFQICSVLADDWTWHVAYRPESLNKLEKALAEFHDFIVSLSNNEDSDYA